MTNGNAMFPLPLSHVAGDYADLKSQVKEAGLLEKQPRYYLSMLVLLVALLALSVILLLFVKLFWLQLLNAAFLAFLTTQFGLLGHAAGHRQLFRKTRNNDLVGLFAGNLAVGLSSEWWMERHNKHHSHPNQHDVDPDVFIPVIAFTPEDLQGKAQNKLKETQPFVRAFCQAHALSYYETNMWQSYRETVSSLHRVTAPLRKASRFS